MRKLNFAKALKNALPYVLTLVLVGIMTFVAEILGEWEIIFPEITALAIGYCGCADSPIHKSRALS